MKVSNSELRTWRRCPRKWWLAYYRQLMPPTPEIAGPRALGTRIHLALSAYYTGTGDPLDVFRESAREDMERLQAAGEDTSDLVADTTLGVIMLEGYMQWVKEEGMDADLEFISAEEELSAELPRTNGTILLGKLDARVLDKRTGFRWFIDHKTVGNFTTPVQALHMDQQMLTYQMLELLNTTAEQKNKVVAGGIYNMLRKVKRTATAKPPFYQRVEVHHNVQELRSHWAHVHRTVTEILVARGRLDGGVDHHSTTPPNPGSTCSWDCDFFALCPLFDDGSAAEEMVADAYIVGDPYERYKDKKGELSV